MQDSWIREFGEVRTEETISLTANITVYIDVAIGIEHLLELCLR